MIGGASDREIRETFPGQRFDIASLQALLSIDHAASQVRGHLERQVLAAQRLSWAGFMVLFSLRVGGTQEVALLAAGCGLAKPTISGVVDTLTEKGHVLRKQLAGDRRRVEVSLTRKGRSAIDRIVPRFIAEGARLTSHLSKGAKLDLAEKLQSIIDR